MKKSPHELTIQQAIRNAGGQDYRREQEQRRAGDVEADELDAAREWLRHLEAGRLHPTVREQD